LLGLGDLLTANKKGWFAVRKRNLLFVGRKGFVPEEERGQKAVKARG